VSAGEVQVAPGGGAVVAGDAPPAPAEVVRRCDVGEEPEALDVAKVQAGLDEACRIDDEGRLVVLVLALDEPRDAFEGYVATPRIS
jgi:hypothetical protein